MTYAEQLVLFDDRHLRRSGRWRLARQARRHGKGRLLLAGGVITDDQGRILLIHRATQALEQWETPGGKVDRGETPEQAAVRELAEELGIDVTIVADWGSHDFVAGATPMTYALFEAQISSGAPRLVESWTFDEMRFFSWSELLEIAGQLSPNARNLVAMYWCGRLRVKPSHAVSA